MKFDIQSEIAKANAEQLERLRQPSFAEVVQDRASELLTGDFENKQRCREICEELYQLATRML